MSEVRAGARSQVRAGAKRARVEARRVWHRLQWWGFWIVAHAVTGCTYMRSASEPMPKAVYRSLGPARARGLIVLMPGFGDEAETFKKRGFVDALLAANADYDVVAADAHFGYYRSGTLVKRLEADVIGPLLAQGYRELWLMGCSMGGHGAIAYARTHPDKIRGLVLFAPYMGPPDVLEEVQRAGGLCKYRAPAYQASPTGFARANFGWLQKVACETHDPQLWMAVGDEDRLLPADRMLAKHLPNERVLILPGGHGWKVWTPAVGMLAPRVFSE